MRNLITFLILVLFLPIIFKEPSARGQLIIEKITTPTAEQKQARVLGIENDKRSLAINNEFAFAVEQKTSNDKLRAELLKYKKLSFSLTKEKDFYKMKLYSFKKTLKKNNIIEPETQETNTGSDYFSDNTKNITDFHICKKDTVYLPTPHKGFFKRIFN